MIITSNKTNIEERIRPLIPLDDIDISVYEEVLDYAIGDDKINNIAITSPYGGGKSSVIRSYQRKQKCKANGVEEFIYIPILELDEKRKMEENEIEKRIIEHFMSKLEHYSFMNSQLKLIGQKPWIPVENRWLILLPFITIVIYSIVNKITNNNQWNLLTTSHINKSIINVMSGLTVILSPLIAILIIDVIKNNLLTRYLKNIKFGGIQLEIPDQESKDTLISVNRSDVLYLLSKIKSGNRVIVFEDIDRFENKKVFNDLRELNYLANMNRSKHQKLKFIYLIKDDLFNTKEQTKFFDLIIPILPVVDKSNSYAHLMNIIAQTGSRGVISDSYIIEISFYLDDMRLINNVVNEYYIYLERLNLNKVDNNELFNEEQLFSIILYKALFPKDFNNLHKHLSYINYLFDKIDKEIDSKISKNDLENNENIIETIFKEKGEEFYSDILNNDFFKKDENKDIKKEIESNQKLIIFLVREGYINKSYMDYIIDSNNSYLVSKDRKFIRDILDRSYIDPSYRLEDAKTIINLISERIPKDYIFNHYLTKEIVLLDNQESNQKIKEGFLGNIKRRNEYNYIYKYIEFILNANNISPILLNTNKKELIISFLELLHIRNNYFENFPYDDIFEKNKEQIFNHILFLLVIEELNHIFESEREYNKFKIIIEENSMLCDQLFVVLELLELNNELDRFINNMMKLNIKFKNIGNRLDERAFETIYNNNLYEYTAENLDILLERLNVITSGNNKLLTEILTLESLEQLKDYSIYRDNLSILIEYAIYKAENYYIEDVENVVIYILNSDIELNLKEKYVDMLHNKIENISKINKYNSLELLIDRNLIEFKMSNLLYMHNIKDNYNIEKAINYINKQYENSNSELVFDKSYSVEDIYSFFIWTLEVELNHKFIIDLIEFFEELKIKDVNELNLYRVEDEVIGLFVEYNILYYNIDNYNKIRDSYNSYLIKYILNHIDKFLVDLQKGTIDCRDDILEELLSYEISDKNKIKIVNQIDHAKITVGDIKLSCDVKLYIFKNKLDIVDLEKFISENMEGDNLSRNQKDQYINLIYSNLKLILNSDIVDISKFDKDFILELIKKDNNFENIEVLKLLEKSIYNIDFTEPVIRNYIIGMWGKIEKNSDIYDKVIDYLTNLEEIDFQIYIEILHSLFKDKDIKIELKSKVLAYQIKYYGLEVISEFIKYNIDNKDYKELYKSLNPDEFKLNQRNRLYLSKKEVNKKILDELSKKELIKNYNLPKTKNEFSITPI